jgi:hypothetical protein
MTLPGDMASAARPAKKTKKGAVKPPTAKKSAKKAPAKRTKKA